MREVLAQNDLQVLSWQFGLEVARSTGAGTEVGLEADRSLAQASQNELASFIGGRGFQGLTDSWQRVHEDGHVGRRLTTGIHHDS